MSTPTAIRLFGTVNDSIVDGPGMRFSVFVQGCSHHCPGCHNPESWAFDAGEEVAIDDVVERIFENKLVSGVTLSGGDPFEQPAACAEIARRVKAAGRNVWVYTGYLYEDLLQQIAALPDGAAVAAGADADAGAADADAGASADIAAAANGDAKTPSAAERERLRAIRDLLAYADVLVDGPFVQAKRSLGLKYCGSSNQRLIDMNKTRKAGRVVLWQSFEDYPTKPPSW